MTTTVKIGLLLGVHVSKAFLLPKEAALQRARQYQQVQAE